MISDRKKNIKNDILFPDFDWLTDFNAVIVEWAHE